MSVITGFYLDYSPRERAYSLFAESADFASYEQTSALSSKWLEGTGRSLSEAFLNLQKNAPKPLSFSHAKIILLSKNLSQNSALETVAFFMENPDINPDILLAVTEISKENLKNFKEQTICKNVVEFLQKENTVNDAKLYRLFSKKELTFFLPRITFYQSEAEESEILFSVKIPQSEI